MNRKFLGTVLGVVVVVAVLWYGYSSWQSRRPDTSGPRQAIFLSDGQIYFGYASSMRNQIVTLVDVYYLLSSPSATDATATSATQKVDLIKLGLGGGDDLIGSEDRMEINRDGIKYMEDMKDDSQINKKISDYLNSKK